MTKTLRATKLFAVMALCGGTAQADVTQVALAGKPAPVAQPLTLATGAPACGNVMNKYGQQEDPLCRVIRINQALEDKGRQLQKDLEAREAAQRRALTLGMLRRLGL